MSLDQAAWAEIARLWLEGREPLSRVGARFGISHQKIVGHARRERWPPRGPAHVSTHDLLAGSKACAADAERPRHKDGPRPGGGDAAYSGREGEAVATGSAAERHACGTSDRAAARRAMVERLFDAMDTKLSAIERRLAGGGDVTPADSERTTRALNTLVRSLEKLADYEGKISNAKVAGRKHGKRREDADDPERRRQELAGRIERLLKGR